MPEIVTYDISSYYTHEHQPNDQACAFTCASMSVKETTATVYAAGFPYTDFSFSGIASYYNYSYADNDTASFANVLAQLKLGRPVIIKTADASLGDPNDHWVLILKFTGVEIAAQAANFYCYDPAAAHQETGSNLICLTSSMYFNTLMTSHKIRMIY